MTPRRPNIPSFRNVISLAFCASLTLLTSGCGGALFKVKPVVELPPLAGAVKSASAGGVTIKVAPLLTDEESQDLFEANLPLGGVIPLRLELEYDGGVPVELKRARFRLRDGAGKEWKLLSTNQAISRIMKANDIYLYNPHSRKRFEEEFGAYAIDVKTPVSPTDRRRQGFLFFQTPNKEAMSSPQGLTLLVERLPQNIAITLN